MSMKKCVFRKRGFEADYVSDYDPDNYIEDDSMVVVVFNDDAAFKETIHIDDGDMLCMLLQKRNGKLPTITR